MSTTSTPPPNGEIPAPDPPVVQSPPMQGSGPPAAPSPVVHRRWYRRGWVIALVALVVGIGLGGASGSSKKAARAATVTLPAQTIVNDVPGPTRTVVHVRRVSGPTKTVTQTVQASTTPPKTPSGGGGAAGSSGLSWSGNGGETIGTINVPQDSLIKWTNDGMIFQIFDNENAIEVNSQASSGQSAIAAGTYHQFQVNAAGNWTIQIVPQ